MKKGLIVLLIFILVVGAFLAGLLSNKVNTEMSDESTIADITVADDSNKNTITTVISTTETTTESTTEKTTTESQITAEMAYPNESYAEGFEKMRPFDSIIKINEDFFYDEAANEGSIVVTNHVDQGYYFEYPYAVNLDIHAAYGIGLNYDHFCTFDSNDKLSFNFVDDYTLIMSDNDVEMKLVVEEVLVKTYYGTIFKGYIDYFGYDRDEYDLYFFATTYNDFISLHTEDCGEAIYYPATGAFSHLDPKRVYL